MTNYTVTWLELTRYTTEVVAKKEADAIELAMRTIDPTILSNDADEFEVAYALPKLKPRPSVDRMRWELLRYEIDEVFDTKDYQAMLEDNMQASPLGAKAVDGTEGWQTKAEIAQYFNELPAAEVEEVWDDTLNAFGEYESKGADV